MKPFARHVSILAVATASLAFTTEVHAASTTTAPASTKASNAADAGAGSTSAALLAGVLAGVWVWRRGSRASRR